MNSINMEHFKSPCFIIRKQMMIQSRNNVSINKWKHDYESNEKFEILLLSTIINQNNWKKVCKKNLSHVAIHK